MSESTRDGVRPAAEAEPTVDAVRQAALDLLGSLPDRPERLRLSAANVTVDLDWRTPRSAQSSGYAPAPEPDPAEPAPPETNGAGPVAHYVCAPSVGTFYHAPAPGAAPFVTEGATVNPGQQVGIVEAMKLMLPVEADRVGRVVEVLVADGRPVEYGERLLAVEPAGPAEP
ncbi:acetyl-CoA carboxylase biotin carboxyl carrier protein [Amycolatopsis nigrescens]|uniref:acetyl-CoA carboxylase biotin carboxyl carrier protein n=1 Tax=Amycolatopsis nigrescens TaxID=381445 RepID=UPI000369BE56|nr:biotin/lipoyl-containing protein [Amycolatopsis nigrescens]